MFNHSNLIKNILKSCCSKEMTLITSPIIISLTVYTNSSEPMVIVEEDQDEIEYVEVEEVGD